MRTTPPCSCSSRTTRTRSTPDHSDGTRGQLDRGVLGVIALTGPPPRGLEEWAAATCRVDSATTVALGIDGESVAMSPPLLFESDPLALRVRLPVGRTRRGAPHVGRPEQRRDVRPYRTDVVMVS